MEVKYYRRAFFPLCELYTDVTRSVSIVRYLADAALQKHTELKEHPLKEIQESS